MPTYTAQKPESAFAKPVEPGIYEVEILKAIEKISEKGNEMIVITVAPVLGGGRYGQDIFDHLVFTAKATWKIDQFLASIGIATVPGEPVTIEAAELIGKTGVAEIGTEQGTTNPNAIFNKVDRWIFGDERTAFLRNKRVEKFANPEPLPKAKKDDDISW